VSAETQFLFHNKVGFQVTTSDPEARQFFTDEYRNHLLGAGAELPADIPRVTLDWRRGPGALAGNQSRFHTHKILARWSYQVDVSDQEIAIRVTGNRYAVPMVHHMMVHPALRYLAGMQGVLMLHGAAVVKNGHSVILTGRGGAGKTTTSSMLLAQGGSRWRLHADDYVFIGPGPKTYCYMTRSHLYKDLLRWLPDLRSRLTLPERVRLLAYGTLREWTREGIKWPVRLSAGRLWPDHQLADQAVLGKVLLLRRAAVEVPQFAEVESLDEVVEQLVEMNFYEARHFIALLEKKPGDPMPQGWLQEWQQRERDLLHRCLSHTSVSWLELPEQKQLDPQLGRDLANLIGPCLHSPQQENLSV